MTSAALSPLHPEVRLRIVGEDGNAFAILGRCRRAAREAGLPKEEISHFFAEATAGNYDHLLATAMRWFDVR
jgi:hypothetical protein